MVDEERRTAAIAMIRDNADVIWEDNNVAALPSGNIVEICSKTLGVALEISVEILDTAKVDVFVWRINIVSARMIANILIEQLAEIVASAEEGLGNNVRANTVIIIRIASSVIFALVFRLRSEIGAGALEDVGLIVDAVLILVVRAAIIGDAKVGVGILTVRDEVEAIKYTNNDNAYASESKTVNLERHFTTFLFSEVIHSHGLFIICEN